MRFAVAAFCCACSAAGDAARSESQSHDSAGVQFVDNPFPPPERWKLDSIPLAVVSDAGDSMRIGQVAGMAILRDNTLLIADAMEKNVRQFDSGGRFLRLVVRNGEGPAELENVSGLFVTMEDSAYVFDAASGSFQVLTPAGLYARKVSRLEFRPDSLRRQFGSPRLVGVLDDGSIVTRETGQYISRAPLKLDRPDEIPGDVRDKLMAYAYRRGLPGERILSNYVAVPVADSARAGLFLWREGVSSAFGSYLYFSPGDTLGYSMYSDDGRLARVVTVRRARTPIRMPDLPGGSPRIHYQQDVPRMLHGPDGSVWLEGQAFSGMEWKDAMLNWFVFDDGGVLQAWFPVHASFSIMAIRGDLVAGVYSDTLEQTVQLRRLHKK